MGFQGWEHEKIYEIIPHLFSTLQRKTTQQLNTNFSDENHFWKTRRRLMARQSLRTCGQPLIRVVDPGKRQTYSGVPSGGHERMLTKHCHRVQWTLSSRLFGIAQTSHLNVVMCDLLYKTVTVWNRSWNYQPVTCQSKVQSLPLVRTAAHCCTNKQTLYPCCDAVHEDERVSKLGLAHCYYQTQGRCFCTLALLSAVQYTSCT